MSLESFTSTSAEGWVNPQDTQLIFEKYLFSGEYLNVFKQKIVSVTMYGDKCIMCINLTVCYVY